MVNHEVEFSQGDGKHTAQRMVSQRFLDEIENVAHSSPYYMVVVYMVILLMLTTIIMELG